MNASKKNKEPAPPKTVQTFPIVGIGASAGGLDAFKRLLRSVPEDSGMAYVLIQHLDPTHASILPEILSRVTKLPVHEIVEDIHLAPDHIYVIPENKILISTDGILKLTPRDSNKRNLPIDIFFTSLAEVHKELAVGVVLSGTGADGTRGLKEIKAHGGITIAQEHTSAAFGDMPQSAINAGVVDFILTPENIPEHLVSTKHNLKKDVGDNNPEELPESTDQQNYIAIIGLLRRRSGVDFTYYKQPTIRRRIARRMSLRNLAQLADYLKILISDLGEQDALFQDLLIPVTSFFRDQKAFDALAKTVFPELLKNKVANEHIRIWVTACSTGEEAFSIAIALHEFLTRTGANTGFNGERFQIFGTDISESAIAQARKSIYSRGDVEKLSAKRRQDYFIKTPSGYRLNKSIRDLCVFAVHNFLKDPPFAKMDLITCRNVLIYMDPFLQKKALITFHYALKKNGFLLLGKSETSSPVSDLFISCGKQEKIYLRKDVPTRFIAAAGQRKDEDRVTARKEPAENILETDFRKNAEGILLSRYTPASVIVNDQLDIVHIHGAIAPFLEPHSGKPTYNIVKMAHEGLAFELRNALHKAKTNNAPVLKERISMFDHKKPQLVSIEVIPLVNIADPHYLVVFKKTPVLQTPSTIKKGVKKGTDELLLLNHQLDIELVQTREDMRSITEDQEAANEELQSANEELLSSAEELQSLNEELETSKEELQSSNEELVVINQELLDKQEQLNAARQYAESIIITIREPLLVLDKNLRIKTANASFYKKFNVAPEETEGKFIYEIQEHRWDNTVLRELLQKVLLKNAEVVDHEMVIHLPSLGKYTMLLNAKQVVNEKSDEQLILLAIEDISQTKAALEQLKNFSTELEELVRVRTEAVQKTNAELSLTVKELKEANFQLDQFINIASHDLQEPLRQIITFALRLQEKHVADLPVQSKTWLTKIEKASLHMRKLIQDLLSYSTFIHYEKTVVSTDLNKSFRDCLKPLEGVIKQKNAEIKSTRLPVIEAMPEQMESLFYNLISNALKFSKATGKVRIDVSSLVLSKRQLKKYPALNGEGDYHEIIIKDKGIGFKQEYAEKIFIIFQRLHHTSKYEGNGIGLAVSKKIIDNHRGEIFAKSKLNAGAEFHFILPAKQMP